jgi:hypothetical protein
LALKANLVLNYEFCSTKVMKGSFLAGEESFPIGEKACPKLETALSGVFAGGLTKLKGASEADKTDADLTLSPKFVDLGATRPMASWTERELVILIEWTAVDRNGKTIWVQTVQGTASGKLGTLFQVRKQRRLLLEQAIQDLADKSASQISSSPELRKLAP